MIEKHYTPAELGQLVGFSAAKIRQLFKSAPGVVREGNPSSSAGKRAYVSIRIPESVARKVLNGKRS